MPPPRGLLVADVLGDGLGRRLGLVLLGLLDRLDPVLHAEGGADADEERGAELPADGLDPQHDVLPGT